MINPSINVPFCQGLVFFFILKMYLGFNYKHIHLELFLYVVIAHHNSLSTSAIFNHLAHPFTQTSGSAPNVLGKGKIFTLCFHTHARAHCLG